MAEGRAPGLSEGTSDALAMQAVAVDPIATEPLAPEPTDPPAALDPAPSAATYTVRPGDTLIGIALDFGVPMAAIQLSNDLGKETMVWVDQILTIPQGGIWANASPFWSVYEVVSGDTLSEVAARFDLDLGRLLTVNGLSDEDLIAVGQALILPVEGAIDLTDPAGLASSQPPPEPTVAPTVSPEPQEVTALDDAAAQAGAAGEVTASVEPEPTPTSVPQPTPDNLAASEPVPHPDTSALASEIFRLLNEQRAAYGLPPLAWNGTLARAAQLHADDCYARGWCGHTGSDGSSYKQRIIRAGYDPVRWSECWAWYGTPERAVAMWMDEVPPNDPHRRTILSDYLTEVGVGVVPGNGRGYYFIADFGTPRQ